MNGWVIALEVVCFFVVLLFIAAILKDQKPTLRFDAALREVRRKQKVKVNLIINHIKNLGAFEFDLLYDPAVLRVVRTTAGDVVGKKRGRNLRSGMDNNGNSGKISITGVIKGDSVEVDHPGVLTTFEFTPYHAGRSRLQLQNVHIRDRDGHEVDPDRIYDTEINVQPDDDAQNTV